MHASFIDGFIVSTTDLYSTNSIHACVYSILARKWRMDNLQSALVRLEEGK